MPLPSLCQYGMAEVIRTFLSSDIQVILARHVNVVKSTREYVVHIIIRQIFILDMCDDVLVGHVLSARGIVAFVIIPRRRRRRPFFDALHIEVEGARLCANVLVLLIANRNLLGILIKHLDVKTDCLKFLDEHLKGLWHTWLWDIVSFNDGFIRLDTSDHIVGLHCEDLLQCVRSTIRLKRPDLHLAKALAAKLRLAAERLLGDERIWSRGARVYLIIHQMMQLQHIDAADRDAVLKRLARAPVIEHRLAIIRQSRRADGAEYVIVTRAVKDGRCDVDARTGMPLASKS